MGGAFCRRPSRFTETDAGSRLPAVVSSIRDNAPTTPASSAPFHIPAIRRSPSVPSRHRLWQTAPAHRAKLETAAAAAFPMFIHRIRIRQMIRPSAAIYPPAMPPPCLYLSPPRPSPRRCNRYTPPPPLQITITALFLAHNSIAALSIIWTRRREATTRRRYFPSRFIYVNHSRFQLFALLANKRDR